MTWGLLWPAGDICDEVFSLVRPLRWMRDTMPFNVCASLGARTQKIIPPQGFKLRRPRQETYTQILAPAPLSPFLHGRRMTYVHSMTTRTLERPASSLSHARGNFNELRALGAMKIAVSGHQGRGYSLSLRKCACPAVKFANVAQIVVNVITA